jgi:hypothetical protein
MRANAILRNTGKQNPSAIAAFLCFQGFSRSKKFACCKMSTGGAVLVRSGRWKTVLLAPGIAGADRLDPGTD